MNIIIDELLNIYVDIYMIMQLRVLFVIITNIHEAVWL